MIFQNQEEFIAFLCAQTELNYSYSFLPKSQYPINVTLKRTPNRLVIMEV